MSQRAVIEWYFACANEERWDDLRELFHSDATLAAVGTRTRVGIDAVDVFHLDGERVRSMSSWYDVAYVRGFLREGAAG